MSARISRNAARYGCIAASAAWCSDVLHLCSPCCAGAAIGWLAWAPPSQPVWLVPFPWLWGRCRSRVQALLFATGYQAGATASLVPALTAGGLLDGLLPSGTLWLAAALSAALPWALAHRSGLGCGAAALRFALAAVALALPPLGLILPFHPLAVAGALLPGSGWTGFALVLLGSALLSGCARRWPSRGAGLMLCAALCAPAERLPRLAAGWGAIHTACTGGAHSYAELAQRNAHLVERVRQRLRAGDRVVLLPEAIAGVWSPAHDLWWADLATAARDRAATVVIGAQVQGARPGSLHNAVVILPTATSSAAEAIDRAGMVVPVFAWRPWRRDRGVEPYWGPRPRVIVDRWPVGIAFCFEEVLPWPVLRAFVGGQRARVLIVVADQSWAGLAATDFQSGPMRAWARLFDVPVLRSVNCPRGCPRPSGSGPRCDPPAASADFVSEAQAHAYAR